MLHALQNSEKKDYDVKLSDIKSKYITTDDYNKFTKDIVANRIKSEGLVDKSVIAGFINNVDLEKSNSNIGNKSRIKNRAR